jgi:hypothetical protein
LTCGIAEASHHRLETSRPLVPRRRNPRLAQNENAIRVGQFAITGFQALGQGRLEAVHVGEEIEGKLVKAIPAIAG